MKILEAITKRLPFFLFALSAVFLASSFLIAQEGSVRIALVDSQAAIRAHSSGEASSALEAQAKTEIEALQTDIRALVEKANAGTPLSEDEQSRYQTLSTTLAQVQQRYAQEIGEAVEPALEAVDVVIQEISTENDYTLVLDSTVAGPQGINLIVFAKPGLDITEQVVERVRAQ